MSSQFKEFTGTVTKADVRSFAHPDPYIGRYSNSREHYMLKLLVSFQTESGENFWFYSPGVTESIICPVGCPIAIHLCDSNDWIDGSEDNAVATAGKPNSGIKGSKLAIGQAITVKAKVKKESTRFGTQLFYTKLVSVTEPVYA